MRPNTIPSIIFICLFLSICLWLGSASPKYEQIKELRLEKRSKEAELLSKKEYLSQLKQVYSELQKHKASLSKIDTALSPDPCLSSIFNFLQKISSENGLVIKNINFRVNPLKERKEIKEIKINLSLAGSYSAFKNFLSKLESNSRLFVVDNISFSSPPEKDLPFHFNLIIETYSY